jgi:FG-GAP-like repeat
MDYASPGVVLAMAVADLNGDKKPDIVFLSNSSNSGVADLTQTTIEALINNGNGTFQPATKIEAQPNLAALAVADVNGDGIQDLIVSTSNQFASVSGNVLAT